MTPQDPADRIAIQHAHELTLHGMETAIEIMEAVAQMALIIGKLGHMHAAIAIRHLTELHAAYPNAAQENRN